ncbi:ABC transporter ATP-binding protein [Pseudomonadota bacterium]
MLFSKKLKNKTDVEINYNSTFYLVKRLAKENIVPNLPLFLFDIFLMLIIAGLISAQAWLIKPALDMVFVERNTTMLVLIPIVIMVVAGAKAFINYFQTLIMILLNTRMRFDIQKRMYHHFLNSDMSVLNQTSSGHLMSRILNDVNGMMSAITVMLTGVIKQFITVISLTIVMFAQSFELSLIAFVAFPLAAYPIYKIGKKLREFSAQNQASLEKLTSQMSDTLQYTKLVKAYNAEEFEYSRFSKLTDGLYVIIKKMTSLSLISSPMVEMMGTIGIACVIWYGGWKVMNGTTTVGAFFSFFGAMVMAYKPMKSISGLNMTLQIGLMCASRTYIELDKKPQIIDKPNAIELKNAKGNIKFHNVDFYYNAEKMALKNINLEIPQGKTVALVGHSGGGKSTIMSLVLRFYDPVSGYVTIDGHDIRDLKVKSVRNSMALVSQEIQLFDDSIMENIKYGKLDATEKEIIEAAKLADAHEFIMDMPQGYNTMIGQQGIRLSGGQRQRISIARAILYNAPILLLDEATSALDPISEKLIKNALEKLMKGRTTLVIAHRLSTVINADKICVISHGKLVEEGTHKQLIEKNGVYANLYSKQFEIEKG